MTKDDKQRDLIPIRINASKEIFRLNFLNIFEFHGTCDCFVLTEMYRYTNRFRTKVS